MYNGCCLLRKLSGRWGSRIAQRILTQELNHWQETSPPHSAVSPRLRGRCSSRHTIPNRSARFVVSFKKSCREGRELFHWSQGPSAFISVDLRLHVLSSVSPW